MLVDSAFFADFVDRYIFKAVFLEQPDSDPFDLFLGIVFRHNMPSPARITELYYHNYITASIFFNNLLTFLWYRSIINQSEVSKGTAASMFCSKEITQ